MLNLIPKQFQKSPEVLRLKGQLYSESGDYRSAEEYWSSYLEEVPDDLNVALNVADLKYRAGKTDEVDTLLQRFEKNRGTTVHWLSRYSALLFLRGRAMEAMKVAFDLRNSYRDHPEAHLSLMRLFLNDDSGYTHLLHATVQVDDVVTIREPDGSTKHILISQTAGDLLLEMRLHVSHPIAQKLLQRQVGDRVTIPSNFGDRQIEILGIANKYVYAYRESIDNFNLWFPSNPAVSKGSVLGDAESGLSELVISQIDSAAQRAETLRRLYREERVPLALVAKLWGIPVIDAFSRIRADGKPIFCCVGTLEERVEASRTLEDAKQLLVDSLTLATIDSVNRLEVLTQGDWKLLITGATRSAIGRLIEDRRIIRKGSFSLVREGGEVRRIDHPAEVVEREIERLEHLGQWMDTHCELVPAIEASANLVPKLAGIRPVLDIEALEVLRAASGSNAVLLCEDLRLRSLARETVGVSGIWTQIVLDWACNRKLLSVADYAEAVAQLLGLGLHFCWVDGEMLFSVAKSTAWEVNPTLALLGSNLGAADTSAESTANVIVQFARRIWEGQTPDRSDAMQLTHWIFDAAGISTRADAREVLRHLLAKLQMSSWGGSLVPVVMQWCASRFLTDFARLP